MSVSRTTCERGSIRIAPAERSQFVKKYGVYRLVYVETFASPLEAISREKQLKDWRREWKIQLIEEDNLDWSDLSHLL